MKNLMIIYLFSVGMFFGCEKENTLNSEQFCNVNNPLQDLPWLSGLIDSTNSSNEKMEVYKCTFNDQDGFIVDLCVNCPDGIIQFYDCSGIVICEFGGIDGRSTCSDFESNITNKVLIWTND